MNHYSEYLTKKDRRKNENRRLPNQKKGFERMKYRMTSSTLTRAEQIQQYILRVKPILNQKALFTDGTEEYRKPMECEPGDKVTLRFRTARDNVDTVILHYGNEKKSIHMRWSDSDELFDYYETDLLIGEEAIPYYFEVITGGMRCFYNKKGAVRNLEEFFNFKIIPGFQTPDWAKGAVIYQIFVDRFYNGDTTNDVLDKEYVYINEKVSRVTNWDKYPDSMGVREFYGGDIQGVMDKLDYLQNLGVEVIYFNPIFVSPSNHKYDIQDYDYIDPHYGKIVYDEGELLNHDWERENKYASRYINRVTSKKNLEASNELFAEFMEEVHKRGMKVILDGVFNHCGSFNKWMDRERIYEEAPGYEKGAYVAYDSPYRFFFKFYDDFKWPYNASYDGWWGHDTLPKLNYEESQTLYNYILNIGRKWVSPPYNVDGWRLDVAADLGHSAEYNHKFWRDFRKAVKEANPNAIILAEHYGDPGDWLQGDQWDTVMNYDAFMEPITWFLTGVEKHSDEYRGELLGNSDAFYGAMEYHMSRYHTPSLMVSMNELSNHDHSRFLTRTNSRVGRTHSVGAEAANEGIDKSIFRMAVLMQMTWPGAPTIYYGDEAGVCGWTDPDNRRSYPWGKEDKKLIQYHKDMISIHKKYRALKTGSIKFLHGGYRELAYGRFAGNEKILVIVNSNLEAKKFRIPVSEIGVTDKEVMEQIMLTVEEDYTMDKSRFEVQDGMLNITMPKKSANVLVSKKK